METFHFKLYFDNTLRILYSYADTKYLNLEFKFADIHVVSTW